MNGIEYHVHSLSALADQFDCYAEKYEQKSKQLQVNVLAGSRKKALECAATAATWYIAANILRRTVLTTPKSSV
jgi:hypothetical protein